MGQRPRIAGYCRVLPRSGTWGNSECEVWNYPSPKPKVHPPSLELLRRTRSPMPKVRRVGDRRSNEAKGNGRTAYPDRLVGAYGPPGTASELGARPGAWTGVSAAPVGACSAGATIPTAKAVGYCQTPPPGLGARQGVDQWVTRSSAVHMILSGPAEWISMSVPEIW
jgi:hypothetical protein